MAKTRNDKLLMPLTLALLLGSANAGTAGEVDILNEFNPSGWMGDAMREGSVAFDGAWHTNPRSPPAAVRITYTPGPEGWAGIYWLNLPNNWGERPGENLSGEDFTHVSFWARGETGSEVVEFKAGGVDAEGRPHRDSFSVTAGRVVLTTQWQEYEIPLVGEDLSEVIGGFAWFASSLENTGEVIFYLDDVRYVDGN